MNLTGASLATRVYSIHWTKGQLARCPSNGRLAAFYSEAGAKMAAVGTDCAAPPVTSDAVSVELSARRTGMSFQRTRMSADRTLMSVIRTSLSLISFGFTIFQLFLKMAQAKILPSGGGARDVGMSLVVLGIVTLVCGIGYHLAFMRGLRAERKSMVAAGLVHGESRFPISLTLLVAIAMLLIGVYAIASMLFHSPA
ncbi:MAG: DUF202 domain-containing protein [Pseudoxanthomonas sp.]